MDDFLYFLVTVGFPVTGATIVLTSYIWSKIIKPLFKDGGWTKPINLGSAVNSNFNETCPSITPDGKYLFFSRYDEEGGLPNVYWVSAEIINKIKTQ